MPYIAVNAGLNHTTQFHLPRTVATVLNQRLCYGFNLKKRVFMKIMNSLCPASKKMVHIALCTSALWSEYLDSRLPTDLETYNKDHMPLYTSTWYPHCLEDLYRFADQGGGGVRSTSLPTLLLRGGGGVLMFTFKKISLVIFV